MAEKWNEDGVRVCDQAGCQEQAVFWYVWSSPSVACAVHAEKVLGVAAAMGFPTPGNTMRLLKAEEMVRGDDPESQ